MPMLIFTRTVGLSHVKTSRLSYTVLRHGPRDAGWERMPRELITVQVGQCGNQVGRRFWEMALEEHSQNNPEGIFDEAMTSFFRNVDARYDDSPDLPFSNGKQKVHSLRARAVLVDMEEGPVSETMRGPLGELFDQRQFITDVSGAGNNFAHGFGVYGPQYGENILEALRHAAERCDSLQSFFLMHSLGGGTGSGLGSYILGLLEENFPEVHRFTTSVFPSEDDDVVTSPYNSVLALHQLTEHADCVLPVENQSLVDLASSLTQQRSSSSSTSSSLPSVSSRKTGKVTSAMPAAANQGRPSSAEGRGNGFDDVNGILARVLIDLTASMRFAGDLNVDLNEITTNLVPYPRMHYLLSSLSPLGVDVQSQSRGIQNATHQLRQVCNGVFARNKQLMRADPKSGTMLACALLFRGRDISISDVRSNVQRLQSEMRMIHWNREGFKIGLCSTPPVDRPASSPSLLSLSNSCCLADTFAALESRFARLYTRRAMLHHYTQYMEVEALAEAREDLLTLIDDYRGLGLPQPRIPGGLPPRHFQLSPLF